MGAFQKIPGFRVLPSRSGFDDVIMKNTAFIVKEAFG